jgi:outer membrane protein
MKKLLAIAIASAAPFAAQADLLFTIEAGASSWNVDASGEVDNTLDIEDDLQLDSEANNVLYASFEHPLPVLPNIKVMKTDLELTGNSTVNNFLGTPLTGETESLLDLSHTDLTLYWGVPLPIPYVDVNFGLTARQFDGEVMISEKTGGVSEGEKLDFTMPMGYLNVDIDTPFGVYAYADVNALSFDGNGVTDTAIALGYTLPVPVVDVSLEAGQRSISVTTDQDTVDIETDIDLSGMFFGLNVSVGL